MNSEQWFWNSVERGKVTAEEACRLFDALEPVEPETLIDTWKGHEFFTGHPLDGWLTRVGWYGKAFHSPEHVDPILFKNPLGKPFPLHPFPPAIVGNLLFGTRSAARLRKMEYRGKMSAVMVYDQLPIHDHFRKVNDDLLLGMMDCKGAAKPYFFLLARVYS